MLTSYSEVYIDPAAGSNVTGDGTIGNPYASLQHAYNNTTHNTTVGTRYNVKSGATDVTGNTSLTLASRTISAPMVIQGYTAAAGDGGVGAIDSGTAEMFAGWYNYVHSLDMEYTTSHATGVRSARSITAGCTINGKLTCLGSNGYAIGNTVNGGLDVSGNSAFIYNNFVTSNQSDLFYIAGSSFGIASGNIIVGATNRALHNNGSHWIFSNNSIYSTSGTGLVQNGNGPGVFTNNLIEGCTTAIGSSGGNIFSFGNVSFGHSTYYSASVQQWSGINADSTASESLFVNAAGGDFTPKPEFAGKGSPGAGVEWYRGQQYLLPSTGGSGTAGFTGIRGISRRLGT
jgi:hypothetical protein